MTMTFEAWANCVHYVGEHITGLGIDLCNTDDVTSVIGPRYRGDANELREMADVLDGLADDFVPYPKRPCRPNSRKRSRSSATSSRNTSPNTSKHPARSRDAAVTTPSRT